MMPMAAWLVWLIAGLVLIAAEVASGGLWLLMAGLGALGGAAAQAITGNLLISTVVFAIVTLALIGGIRPILQRTLRPGHDIRTNTQALIGAHATVVSPVDDAHGRVKIDGEVWSARAQHTGADSLEPGSSVIVVEISGATAIVAPQP
jgi:membrane protein implicated in regulation of membrane protease activity